MKKHKPRLIVIPVGNCFSVNYTANGSHPTEELHVDRHIENALIFALGFISTHSKVDIDLSFLREGKEVAKHYLEKGRRIGKNKVEFCESVTKHSKGGSHGKESHNARRHLSFEKLGRVRM